MSDQLVTGATTYKTHNKYRRRISMLAVEFEAAFPTYKWPRIFALNHTAIVIDIYIN
jgi:hypothetical protein